MHCCFLCISLWVSPLVAKKNNPHLFEASLSERVVDTLVGADYPSTPSPSETPRRAQRQGLTAWRVAGATSRGLFPGSLYRNDTDERGSGSTERALESPLSSATAPAVCCALPTGRTHGELKNSARVLQKECYNPETTRNMYTRT